MSSSKPWYAQRCVGVVVCALALVAGNRAHAAPLSGTSATYRGTCDASAAVALDARHFVVGNDETDTLLVYREGQPGAVAQAPLRSFLGGTGRAESDIEGAAAIGSRIYWIASHSRNSRGEAQPMRQRLFATDMVPRMTISARTGTDIIRNPAIVATSWLTASIPAQLASAIPPGAAALVCAASRSMMNIWMRT